MYYQLGSLLFTSTESQGLSGASNLFFPTQGWGPDASNRATGLRSADDHGADSTGRTCSHCAVDTVTYMAIQYNFRFVSMYCSMEESCKYYRALLH